MEFIYGMGSCWLSCIILVHKSVIGRFSDTYGATKQNLRVHAFKVCTRKIIAEDRSIVPSSPFLKVFLTIN